MLLQTKATKAIASMPPDHCLGAPVDIYNFPPCAICLYRGENALVPCPFKKTKHIQGYVDIAFGLGQVTSLPPWLHQAWKQNFR